MQPPRPRAGARRPARGRAALLVLLAAAPLARGQSSAPPDSLKTVPVPLPDALFDYVRPGAFDAAARLGKAFFWDEAAGSDGQTACASCHHHAGADARFKNSVGTRDGSFDALAAGLGGGPNHGLVAADFPFHRLADPSDAGSAVLFDSSNVRGSQGVPDRDYLGPPALPGAPDAGAVDASGPFHAPAVNAGGAPANTRQVTGRDAPSVLGAIFLERLCWDGRAEGTFNGVDGWGARNPAAQVWELPSGGGAPVPVSVAIEDAATASQASGPPLDDVELSWHGRDFPAFARRLLPLAPLAGQTVHPSDDALGALSAWPAQGLSAGLTYRDLVEQAFEDRWWAGGEVFPGGPEQIEANFALLWGLAILCYEATLVPDETPFDVYMDGGGEGGANTAALSFVEKLGLQAFLGEARCARCHEGPELAGAAVGAGAAPLARMPMADGLVEGAVELSTNPGPGQQLLTFDPRFGQLEVFGTEGTLARGSVSAPVPPGQCGQFDVTATLAPGSSVPPNASGFEALARLSMDGATCEMVLRVELRWSDPAIPAGTYQLFHPFGSFFASITMPPAPPQAVYDRGFYNVGVRPIADDPGVGADGPFGPLSLSRRAQLGEDFGAPVPPVGPNERLAVDGAFKAPALRNVGLTGPYMHNGGMATLDQVLAFYERGTDFGADNATQLPPGLDGFALDAQAREGLLAFLEHALTDPRVKAQSGPFSHPSLSLRHGHVGSHLFVLDGGGGEAVDQVETLLATGADGGPALVPFEERLAFGAEVWPLAGIVADEGAAAASPAEGSLPPGETFAVKLRRDPATNVLVRFAISDAGELVLEPDELVFTPADALRHQSVRVRGVADNRVDGDTLVTIQPTTQSTDPRFDGLALPAIKVLVVDDGRALGTLYCGGDGAFVPCPCGNASFPGAFEGCVHGGGRGTALRATGSAEVAADDLVLQVTGARPGKNGLFLQGAAQNAAPFQGGLLCVGNPTERLEFTSTDAAGAVSSTVSIVTEGGAVPGATLYYQFWHRDGAGAPCGAPNLSNGVAIDWF